MNICIIGKYFPIQGGVSKDNQWLAYALAQAGFQVHIVTNAEEVEPQYRCLDWSPSPLLQHEYSGTITLHTTSKTKRHYYIPYANPFVTKLAALATDVITTYNCDLIYGYYLEPYVLAAYLASQWTGVPYGFRHAGSDIGSLFQSPELQTTYRQIMLAADYVVTSPTMVRGFLQLGVAQDKIYLPDRSSLHTDYFSPEASPLDINALLSYIRETLPQEQYYEIFRHFAQKPFQPNVPTIGIYGKVGHVKGSFDLLAALARLRSEGTMFNLLALTQGNSGVLAEFAASIEEHELADVTWLLPFLPHWCIPQFIRTCTAICFLERDFPIPVHTPLIPREVFACGTCLVLSHEIAEKQSYRQKLQHGSNVFLVDPHNLDALTGILRTILNDPVTSQQVGQNGYRDISVAEEDWPAYTQSWTQLFTTIHHDIQQRNVSMSVAEMQACLARLYTDDAFRKLFAVAPDASLQDYILTEDEKQALLQIDQKLLEYFAASLKLKQFKRLRPAYPATFALPEALLHHYYNRFYQLYPARPHEDAFTRTVDFGVFMEQCLATDEQAPDYASEVARYERIHYTCTYQPLPSDALMSINEKGPIKPLPLRLESIPVLCPGAQVETFTYPIVSIVGKLREQRPVEAIQPGHHVFLFFKQARSLTINVFALNQATAHLLSLCEGTNTVTTIIQEVERQLGETALANDVLATLNSLREKQIIGEQTYA